MSSKPFFTFGDCCLKGSRLPGEPSGEMIKEPSGNFHIPYYKKSSTTLKSSPQTTTITTSKTAIVIFYDIFGLGIPNPKIIADTLCAQLSESSEDIQIDVFIPDIIPGAPVPEASLEPLLAPIPAARDTDPNGPTKKGILSKIWGALGLLPHLPKMFQLRGAVVEPRCVEFLKGLRKEGYEKVGAVGFCFGGIQIISLLGSPLSVPPNYVSPGTPVDPLQPLLDTAIIAHPGSATFENIKQCRIPTAWICAEEDFSFGDAQREKVEGYLKENKEEFGIDYEMRVFDYTVHGFASRPALEYEPVRKAFLESGEMMREWFKKYLLA